MKPQVSLAEATIRTAVSPHPAERRMHAEEWSSIRRVLVVRLDNIGDVVLLGPALRAIKSHAPGAHVTLLTSPAGASVSELVPGIDDTFTYRAEWQDIGNGGPHDTRAFERLVHRLREGSFDAAIIFTSFSQSPHPAAMACMLADIPRRISQSKEFGGALLTHWVTPLADEQHQVDRNLYLLQTAGVPPQGRRLALHVPDDARACVETLLGSHGIRADERVLLAVPGASCPTRRADADRMAEALTLIAQHGDARVIVGGSEKERWIGDMARARSDRIISLAGLTSVRELAALVERADAVIAANSATMHFADALDRPLVVLYSGADHPEQWRPRNTPSVMLGSFAPCAPCHLFECADSMSCLDVSSEEIAERALRMLELGALSQRPNAVVHA